MQIAKFYYNFDYFQIELINDVRLGISNTAIGCYDNGGDCFGE